MFKGHGGYIKHITSQEAGGILDFSASINPLGYPVGVRKIVWEKFDDIAHYPDIDCSILRKHIAQKIGRAGDEIVVGNGSTELFHLIPRALRPARGAVFQPTFNEFAEALKCGRAEVAHHTLREEDDFHLQWQDNYFSDKNIEMAFLCNPNNPTGHLVEKTVITAMARRHPQITFVIDEAFIDYVDEPEKYSVIQETSTTKNLIVVRSLTKFYGFPGLRIGYLAAHADVVRKLMEYKEPWSVNALAQCAALEAIKDDAFYARSREFMADERRRLFGELSRIPGLMPYEPTVNYVFVRITASGMDAPFLRERMLEQGIAIRDCSNFVGLSDKYFRVAVRTREENARLIAVLKNVIGSHANTFGLGVATT